MNFLFMDTFSLEHFQGMVESWKKKQLKAKTSTRQILDFVCKEFGILKFQYLTTEEEFARWENKFHELCDHMPLVLKLARYHRKQMKIIKPKAPGPTIF